MEKITQDYLLKEFRRLAIIGIEKGKHNLIEEAIIFFGKVKFIKDLLLRAFDFDIEVEDIYDFNLYKDLWYFVY